MQLTLKVSSYCDAPPADPQVRSYDCFPIILGRSTACDYCLDDASQYVSSNHAVILLEGSQFLIKDTSSNGIYVNGVAEPVGRGQTLALKHADTLAIGDYTLTIAIAERAGNSRGQPTQDPFDLFESACNDDAVNAAAAHYDPFRGAEPDWTHPTGQTDDPETDDFDFIDSSQGGSAGSSDQKVVDWADWPEDMGLARRSTATQDAPAIRHTPARQASRPDRAEPPTDPFASKNNHLDWFPGTHDETVSNPLPAEADSGNLDSSRSELNLILRAASLRESDFAHLDSTEVLEQMGRLLTQMVDAMMVLLNSRTELKNVIRSDVTTLAGNDNNPLKFSLSSADALSKMLANDSQGYLQSDIAVQEAVEDLKVHQLAMLEGMKSAVKSMLLQFDPNKLARTLECAGGITANIPITREARLWELFCEQYDEISEEAVSDFGNLFGAEFRKAYEKRIRKSGRRTD